MEQNQTSQKIAQRVKASQKSAARVISESDLILFF